MGKTIICLLELTRAFSFAAMSSAVQRQNVSFIVRQCKKLDGRNLRQP